MKSIDGMIVSAKRIIYGDTPGDVIEPETLGVILAEVPSSNGESDWVVAFQNGMCIDFTDHDKFLLALSGSFVDKHVKNIDPSKLIEKLKNGTIKLQKYSKK